MLANALSYDLSPTSAWEACLRFIEGKVGPATFETWLRATELALGDDGQARIQVPNKFFADFVEENFAELIREALIENEVVFTSLVFEPVEREWSAVVGPLAEEIAESIERERKAPQPAVGGKQMRFHPNYTFDTFVVGDGNRMAHAAALAVAEAPGQTKFNPLVLYGGTGLGKTHILQAIGHFAQTEHTAEKTVYMTSEEFTNQYIDFVINKKDSFSFYKKFNDVDVLLIDDIQFFSGKEGTQDQFFRIFDRLLRSNKQIVLSSDRQPDKIPDMMERIINRLKGGLNADIQPPNLETRMAILRKKAEFDGLNLPEEVIQYIAGHITSNVRELEGTLIKLIASSSFSDTGITLDIAKELCGDALSRKDERLSVRSIMQATAQAYGIGINQLSAHSRKKEVTLPRSVAMYLCKKLTKQSLRSIGLEFGGRDYSTVIHASKKIDAEMGEGGNAELQAKIAEIESLLVST
ncbi:MAG: chromosomal replication initiator protein DnaA [Chitinispirillales bacterium]|jgi:chromosomal replication initiator protein|nr:chromosomal replication initiator protein DnaA [Chitinispirillales bacterium]